MERPMDQHIPWVPNAGSDEVGKAIEKHAKQPRCYRERKLCPQSGCDCETSHKTTLIDAKEAFLEGVPKSVIEDHSRAHMPGGQYHKPAPE